MATLQVHLELGAMVEDEALQAYRRFARHHVNCVTSPQWIRAREPESMACYVEVTIRQRSVAIAEPGIPGGFSSSAGTMPVAMRARTHLQDGPVQRLASASDLGAIRLFRGIPETTLQRIAERGHFERMHQGEFLFFEGDPATDVHFLLAGQVKIVHETEDGAEVILRLINPGEIFGGAGGWGDDQYPATAIALDDVSEFRLPAAEFSLLLSRHPAFAQAMILELATRLREAEARIRELQAERVERRIARTLLRLAGRIGNETPLGIEIELPQSRQHLAELTGATLTTVSRVLSEWDRRGLIDAGRERVTIAKPHELVMVAEDLTPTEHDSEN